MPTFSVNSDETEQTSAALLNDFTQLQDKLTDVRNKVQTLLANGYSTPAAQQRFQPFFEEFGRGFEQVNQGLEGISRYVRAVGEAFTSADDQLGASLPG
ncbi:WXG100 family type VII secretion target [Micromonospora sp. NBC_01813]|uniref:WXG100 family type VII secretion target n=1 Tax=Micromonospora sp. NBC_01813 TaxID=2975988 RepID=UPI002DDB93A6|nr:WXG100 family type VII secretion target [Micromonospora sp. NBC_01813]WSA07524.1 WXG100 family type VII secretion target [Micromonospora sp. NBC_01813]